MNFNNLQIFQSVAHHQNISEVAKQLNISQPAISRTIKLMEEEIGFSLFSHSHNRIDLNNNGTKFLSIVDSILYDYDSCIKEIQEDNGIFSNTIEIALSSVGNHLPNIIYNFKKKYPQTKFILKSYHHTRYDTNSDFVFRSSYEKTENSSNFFLCEEPLYITLNSNNPLSQLTNVKLSDLSSQNFLFSDADNDMHNIQMHYCQCVGFTPDTSNIIEKQHILIMMLELDLGITLLPKIKNSNLVQLPISDIHCSRFIYLIRNRKRFETNISIKFENYCKNYFTHKTI